MSKTKKMSLTTMNFNRIRDLVSNLGTVNDNNTYVLGEDCLSVLESLEDELLNDDVVQRNVRISLHIIGTVEEDLIPILINGRNFKTLATVTRVLVSLSLPTECLIQFNGESLNSKHLNVFNQLSLTSLAVKKAFLNASATASVVTMLRETILKSEKHKLPLKEEECNHLQNCLILVQNILHLPENFKTNDKNCVPKYAEWQSVQNKLIWNLFVQGLDGALILMLNSKYKERWTVPLALIIALLFRNQNIHKIHKTLKMVSSASESSGEDEESDGSKNSSTSLSSEPLKNTDLLSDSGCQLTSESSIYLGNQNKSPDSEYSTECSNPSSYPFDIHKKLEQVQISDLDCKINTKTKADSKKIGSDKDKRTNVFNYENNHSERSSSYESPYHKKIKGSSSPVEVASSSKCDSALSDGMDYSSPEGKSSDDDIYNETRVTENLKAVQKLKCEQMQSKQSESDSSNEEFQTPKLKHRCHPPTGRRGKSPRRNDGCWPSVCMDSAIVTASVKNRMRYPLWEKRNSLCTLLDVNSSPPTDESIGFLLKEFTLSFLHSGFADLVVKIRNLLLKGPSFGLDKSLLFWMLSYFLHLAASVNLSLKHINIILNTDYVSYLIFECVSACEHMNIHSNSIDVIRKYTSVHLNLLVSALKEVMCCIDLYFRRSCSQKDKATFHELYGKLSELKDFRQMPLLLFHSCPSHNSKHFLEEVAVLNHHVLNSLHQGSDHGNKQWQTSLLTHLQQYSNEYIVDCCRKILENFKFNSHFLNECVFTLLHHLAGDIHSSELLMESSLLRVFSEILKDDNELDQYQEDLIVYILSKFSRQVREKDLKGKLLDAEGGNNSNMSDDSSSNSSLSSHCLHNEEDDDLFWWYLQFEQDNDPISRISEHVQTSKQDILSKLQLKGFISAEVFKILEDKIKTSQDTSTDLVHTEELAPMTNFNDDITNLLQSLVQAGEKQHLIWLQDVLLETCFIKLNLKSHNVEPIPFFSMKMMLSVPLVPYTAEHREILKNETFLQLLQKLGLHMGSSEHQMYPRIPLFWTADLLFMIAYRLGPIRKDKMKFSLEELLVFVPNYDHMTNIRCPDLPPLSSCGTLSSWLTAVQQNKQLYEAIYRNNVEF